ncbi:MAG: hypothetical protein NTV21_10090 [Planctomycetota bacterium]|nr:hypothetical protein [Planctomycetota bacterium]
MDVEAELRSLAIRRNWRLAIGALLLILSGTLPAWMIINSNLKVFEVISKTANPTPEMLRAGILVGLKWALALGAVFFVSGLVVLGTGIASDRQLKRFRREWAELA